MSNSVNQMCECSHSAEMHPLRMTGRRARREKCFNEGCHCTRYNPLPPHTRAARCIRCSNFALEGYQHCRQCMKELAAQGKLWSNYPCAWCGTWEAEMGKDLCPACQESDENSPTTPPQYKPTAVSFNIPVWPVLTDVPLDTVVVDCHGNHWKCLSSTGLWYLDKPWDEATTFQIDRAVGPFRYIRTVTDNPFAEKEDSTMPKITTTTTTSISSSDGFTIGDLQSFLDQVHRPQGLDTPVTVSLAPNTEWGVDSSAVTLSVTTEG